MSKLSPLLCQSWPALGSAVWSRSRRPPRFDGLALPPLQPLLCDDLGAVCQWCILPWVGFFLFRNLKPWGKCREIWLYPSHARHHRPQPTHLLSETMDLDGRSLKATELSEIPGDKVNIGQLTAIYGVVESRIEIDAWHCMAAKRLSRCQAACKSRKDSWPRCTGSPAAILASHRGE